MAKNLWRRLSITDRINEAMFPDRFGSEVLEVLLRDQATTFPDFDSIGLKETIGVACWYLWWIRQ
jgi:hypothetical protein